MFIPNDDKRIYKSFIFHKYFLYCDQRSTIGIKSVITFYLKPQHTEIFSFGFTGKPRNN